MGLTHWKFTKEGLEKAQEIVEIIKANGIPARIDVTCWVYGAGITWDTILTESQTKYTKGMEFQLLYPREHEKMNEGTLSDDELQEILSRVLQ